MTPTSKLRFVKRSVPLHPFHKEVDAQGNLVQTTQTYRVLQQWWEQSGMTMNMGWGGEMPIGEAKGEWRDVSLEAE